MVIEKKKINYYTLLTVALVLLLAYLVVALTMRGISCLDTNDVFHVAGELVAIAISILIFNGISRIKKESKKSKMMLLAFIITTDVAMCFDILARIVDGLIDYRICNYIFNALVFILEVAAIILYFKFVYIQYGVIRDFYKKICRVIEIIFCLILGFRIAFCFQDFYFYIDEYGYYQTGPYYVFSNITLVVMATIVFSMVVSTSYYSNSRKTAFLAFPVLYATAMVVGMINHKFCIELILTIWAMVFLYVMMFIELREDTRELNQHFNSYMARDIIEEDLSEAEDITKQFREMDVTVMFLGIVDFTKHIANIKSENALILFNHFLDMAINICEKSNGTVLEITSNGIICIFGAEAPREGHVNKAVNAAIAIRNSMRQVNEWNTNQQYPELSISCGIATGEVVLGYIGSKSHARLSAISKNINLCSRLAGMAKENEIIIASHVARNYDGELELSELEQVGVKGYDEPVSFYRLEDIQA